MGNKESMVGLYEVIVDKGPHYCGRNIFGDGVEVRQDFGNTLVLRIIAEKVGSDGIWMILDQMSSYGIILNEHDADLTELS